jgi:transposase-like protein
MTQGTKKTVTTLGDQDKDMLKELVLRCVQEVLEAEMTDALGAGKSERTDGRRGYRSGYYERKLITRVGTLDLRVPQDRDGRFSTEIFERYDRAEKALLTTLVEMYVQGVSTRKVKAITEELCGHEFSASAVSRTTKMLDEHLRAFAERPLDEAYPYVILDARYERVREGGVVGRRAVLIAIGINNDGRRCVLGVELANRESRTTWRDFLVRLTERGLHGVEFVVSDDHEGLKQAAIQTFAGALWQRCYVHFLRNALDHLPRKKDNDCIIELRWIYERRTVVEAQADIASWLKKWQSQIPKLCDWVEDNIEETLTFFRLPQAHHKHMRSTNLLERFNEEIRRRTYVVRVFPNEASTLRLIRALAAEQHEEWQEGSRYLSMELFTEHKKEALRTAA